MKRRFIVLIDFSPNALTLVKLAEKWSEWMKAELLLVHHPEVVYPSLADQHTRDQITASEKESALSRIREFNANNISKSTQVHYQIAEDNLLLTVKDILTDRDEDLVFVGLKSTGVLKRIFPGSTATKLADEVNATIVAVPQHTAITSPLVLYVGIYHKYPLNEWEFEKLLQLFGDKISKIIFLSVLANDGEKQDCRNYLETLALHYSKQHSVSTEIYEGTDAVAELKQYMSSHPGGLLVLQRGPRSITDQLFRKFLIHELVYDATVPLIILPA